MLGESISAGSGITKGLWHLNGNSTDSSGNLNNGTDTAITYSLANGKFRQGINFNNPDNEYVTINDSNSLDITSDFTLSEWIYPVKFGATSTKESLIISKGIYPNYNYRLHTSFPTSDTSGSFGFAIDDGELKEFNTTKTDYPNNTWYNVIGIKSGTNLFIYVNNVLQGTLSGVGTPVANATNVIFGKYINGGGYGFTGSLEEVRIDNVAWSAAQVAKYYAMTKGRWATL